MKTFRINDKLFIVCKYGKTSNGFKHTASLFENGLITHTSKVCYLNRTWESFDFETVLRHLLTKFKVLPEDQIKKFLDHCRKDDLDEINKQFGFITNIAKMGELLTNNQKEANDWKTRMLKAGLENKGLIMPENWNELSENEKENRLNKVINELSK
jgi:hypothetical protein